MLSLPPGIIISPDGLLTSDNGNAKNCSLLMVAFQKSICANSNSISQQQLMEAVACEHNLLSSNLLKIKATLGCSD